MMKAWWLHRRCAAAVIVREPSNAVKSSLIMNRLSRICSCAMAHFARLGAAPDFLCKVNLHTIFLASIRLPQIDRWLPHPMEGGHLAEARALDCVNRRQLVI